MTDKEYSLIIHLRARLYNFRYSAKLTQELNERKNYVYLNTFGQGMISAFSVAIELVEELLKDLGK